MISRLFSKRSDRRARELLRERELNPPGNRSGLDWTKEVENIVGLEGQ